MPTFAYSARNAAGQSLQAELEAPTRKDALRMLASRGLTPVNLSEYTGRPGAAHKAGAVAARRAAETAAPVAVVKLKRSHRLPLLSALYELTTSGLSAGEAVRLLSVRVKDPAIHTLCSGLWERIGEGATLSGAMAQFPEVFDEATLNLMQAGEATGNLNEVLSRIIAHLTEQRELQRQLSAALAYPIFLTCVAAGVVLFFLFFLMPKLNVLFSSLHGDVPLSTRALLALADFTLHYGLIVVIAAVFGVASFWRWRQTESGRRKTDEWMLKVPLLGPFCVAQTVLAFSQTLSVLLENGITTSEALRMTERQIGNRVHREAFDVATGRVLEGEALSQALIRTGCFPDLVLDQLAVGENTGNVVPSLRKIAIAFQRQVSGQLKVFTSVIGSGVLMTVFIFVGFIAFAIVNAVFSLSASIK